MFYIQNLKQETDSVVTKNNEFENRNNVELIALFWRFGSIISQMQGKVALLFSTDKFFNNGRLSIETLMKEIQFVVT